MSKVGESSLVLIDGSNFYYKLKSLDLGKMLSFDYQKFAQLLPEVSTHPQLHYYIGAVRDRSTAKGEVLYANQRRLLAALQKQNVRYTLGYLLKSDAHYHEKGVDVQIAIDMMVATYEQSARRIYLVSSDTDLLPAVKIAKSKAVEVVYVGFSHQPSLAMIANCSQSKLLTKQELLTCMS